VSRQYFEDAPYCDPPLANQTAVTATTETGLWNVSQFTPVPAYDGRAGKIYRLTAAGIFSTGASGTLTITPRWGTTTGGTTFGASSAQTVVASLTNEGWYMTGILTIRSNGAPGANSTAIFNGQFQAGGAAATAGSNVSVLFGGTQASIDLSAAAGLFIGWTLSVAGSCTPQQILWQSCN
jgi:hypothetical protein